jgi:hypothetical protein
VAGEEAMDKQEYYFVLGATVSIDLSSSFSFVTETVITAVTGLGGLGSFPIAIRDTA